MRTPVTLRIAAACLEPGCNGARIQKAYLGGIDPVAANDRLGEVKRRSTGPRWVTFTDKPPATKAPAAAPPAPPEAAEEAPEAVESTPTAEVAPEKKVTLRRKRTTLLTGSSLNTSGSCTEPVGVPATAP